MPQIFRQSLLALSLALAAPILSPVPAFAQMSTEQQSLRLVVLPFKNITQREEDAWLSESFSENVTQALARSQNLRLIERSQIQNVLQEQSFTQSAFIDPESAPTLGKLLGANKILLGNFQNIDNTLVVSTRVVDVMTGQIEGRMVTQLRGSSTDVLALQDRLAQALLQSFAAAPSLSQLPTQSNAAYTACQQAIHLARTGTAHDLERAIDRLEQAIQEDANYAKAHAILAEMLALRARQNLDSTRRQADLQRAIALANRALDLKADALDVYRAMASAYAAQGEWARARQSIEQALQVNPQHIDTLVSFVQYSQLEARSLEARLNTLGAPLSDPWIQLALGNRYLEQAEHALEPDTRSAARLLSEARAQLPQHPLIPLKLAKLYVLERDYARAREQAELAVRLDSENFLLPFLAAQALLYGPDQELVQTWLERSVQLNPEFGYNSMTLGYVHWRNGRLERALDYFKQAEQVFPDNAMLAFVRGKFFFAQRDFEQARQHLQHALELWGQDPSQRIARGSIFLKLGDIEADANRLEQAKDYYQRATESEREIQSYAYLKLSRLQAAQGQTQEALRNFHKHLRSQSYQSQGQARQDQQGLYLLEQAQLRPNDPALLNDLGRLALIDQDYRIADRYFLQALEQDPSNPSIHYNHGLSLFYQQDWRGAIAAFQEVLKRDPAHDKAQYNLGTAYQRLGEIELARKTWRALLQRNPAYDSAREALELL